MADIVLNINEWSYADWAAFRKHFLSGNYTRALHEAIPIAIQWSFNAPLSPHSLNELKVSEIFQLVQSVMEKLDVIISTISYEELVLDLDNWHGWEYDKFVSLGSKTDLTAIELQELQQLLRQIAIFDDGFENEVGLSAVEGWKIQRALTPEIEKFFRRGKTS